VTCYPLRVMTPADLADVLELEHALFGAEAWSAQMLEGELAQQPASRYYLVAEDASARAVRDPDALAARDPGARAVRDPGVRAVRDPGARSVRDPGVRAVRDPGVRAVRDPGALAAGDPGAPAASDACAIVGYAGLLAAGTQADVLTLAVAADRWGQGIGSALLEALLAEAARRGCTEVFLEVRMDNPRAQRLYRRYDFAEIGVRKGYYQPSGADALVMRRTAGVQPRAGRSGAHGRQGSRRSDGGSS
jgi:[ribosomal protein S18]-alanine N-acetyltransferase